MSSVGCVLRKLNAYVVCTMLSCFDAHLNGGLEETLSSTLEVAVEVAIA